MSVLQQCSETMPDTDQASGQRYLVMAGEDAMGLSPHNFIRGSRQRSIRGPSMNDGQIEEQRMHELCPTLPMHATSLSEHRGGGGGGELYRWPY